MPFINSKTSCSTKEKQELLKDRLGSFVGDLGKDQKWVMVAFEDNADLWFGGEKKDKAAYLSFSLVGPLSDAQTLEFTKKVCGLYEEELGIPKENIYITFHSLTGPEWGWNDMTF